MGELGPGAASEEPLGTGEGASEGEPEPKGAEPVPLTREETKALIDAGMNKAVRMSQSLVDKVDHRISGRLTSELKSLATFVDDMKAAGHEVPAEIIERAKHDVVLRSLTGEPAQVEGPSGVPAGQAGKTGEPGEVDSAKATGIVAIAMMEEENCFIEDDDPELKLIDMNTDSPRVFIRSIDTAIDAKQKRLAGASGEEPEGDEGDLAAGRRARTPTGKGKRAPAAIPDGLSPMDYLKRGYSKK